MNIWKVCLMASVVIVAASACAPATPEPAGEPSLVDTAWALETFHLPDGEILVVPGTTVTLAFEEGGQAGGSGGCNSFSAEYSVQGNAISFSDPVRTLKSCIQEGVDAQEQRYLDALQGAVRFERDDILLKIWYDDGDSFLNFVKVG